MEPIFKSEFSIIYQDKNMLILQDLDGPRSITNDMEAVYQRLNHGGLDDRRLFYFDSYGESAEIRSHASYLDIWTLPYKTVERIKEYVAFEKLL